MLSLRYVRTRCLGRSIIGGTGQIGRATAASPAGRWLAGRPDRARPGPHAGRDRRRRRRGSSPPTARIPSSCSRALGEGADLLVDCICYTAADATRLLPLVRNAGSTVMISSKAVYVDACRATTPTRRPHRASTGRSARRSRRWPRATATTTRREGYGANKVAAEQRAARQRCSRSRCSAPPRSTAPARQTPREWVFVKRVLDRRPAVFLARRGAGVDHTTAAANIAALIEVVAAKPGRRILNSADPDAPSALEISRTIARQLDHVWDEVLLDDDADEALGRHPWDAPHPIVLDMTAAGGARLHAGRRLRDDGRGGGRLARLRRPRAGSAFPSSTTTTSGRCSTTRPRTGT